MQVDELKRTIQQEAERAGVSRDVEVYERAARDPWTPILFAGSLDARVAFFARDLGRDEVLTGEPLIGGAGRRVRRAVYRFLQHKEPPEGDMYLRESTQRILLTNTVPYKPVGNKAYPTSVKERLRPYVAELLTCLWLGDYIITLGTEAFQWFAPYAERGAIEAFWKRPDRFEAETTCTLEAQCDGQTVRKAVTLAPLPHPSPLNKTYLELFPKLLKARLEKAPL